MKEGIRIPKAANELPGTAEGTRQLIDGLNKISDESGMIPVILKGIKTHIERLPIADQERESLKLAFDERLSNLLINEMNGFAGKRDRLRKGFNAMDRELHVRTLRMYIDYDIPSLPLFSEERRAALVVRAQQMVWAKGYTHEDKE